MTQLTEERTPVTTTEPDLAAEIHRVLASSPEPLTPAKIRDALPTRCRPASPEELTEALRRLVAANVATQYPKYRSPQDRFWDRSMPVHVAALVREALQEGPLPLSELRRKLPAYAVGHAEPVLKEQITQGLLFRHPPATKRGSERFGAQPPDPSDYLRDELSGVFYRLEQLGFTRAQLRAGALEILHDEEWSPNAPDAPRPPAEKKEEPQQPTATTAPQPSPNPPQPFGS